MNQVSFYCMEYPVPQLLIPNPYVGTQIVYLNTYNPCVSYLQQPILTAIPIETTSKQVGAPATSEQKARNDCQDNQEDRRSARPERKKNIRNIIPNIARKILGFISSEDSRKIITSLFPQMTRSEIMKFYEFTNSIKKSLSFYIGNKDLMKIWYRKSKNLKQAEYYKMIRILSRYFLHNCCVSSILLSKRMKHSLKKEHLRYRRKIMESLERGPRIGKSFS